MHKLLDPQLDDHLGVNARKAQVSATNWVWMPGKHRYLQLSLCAGTGAGKGGGIWPQRHVHGTADLYACLLQVARERKWCEFNPLHFDVEGVWGPRVSCSPAWCAGGGKGEGGVWQSTLESVGAQTGSRDTCRINGASAWRAVLSPPYAKCCLKRHRSAVHQVLSQMPFQCRHLE